MGPLPEVGDEQSRPEIDRFVAHSFFFHLLILTFVRTQLRQTLLDSLEKDTVKWNHKVKSITSLPSPNANCSSTMDTKKQEPMAHDQLFVPSSLPLNLSTQELPL